jgi:acetylornithine/N-succinyldiaminopimelate aminotransferase
VRENGLRLAQSLEQLAAVREVRGLGLLLGVDLERPAADVVADCLERGLLVATAGEHTLRLTPPLTISSEELDDALEILREVLVA